MIRGSCPICAKPYEIQALDDLPSFPFCSERCRLIDLGRWVDGAYAIPANEAPRKPADEAANETDEDA